MLHLTTERRWSAFLAVFLAAAGCDSEVVTEAGSGGASAGNGGSGGGSPSGQGGSPNGQGGSPDEQGGSPNGQGGSPNGQGGSPNGQGGYPNGQGGYPNGPGGYPNGPGSPTAGSPGYWDTVCVDHDELWAQVLGHNTTSSGNGQGGFDTTSSGNGQGGFDTTSSGNGQGGGNGEGGVDTTSSGNGQGGFGSSGQSSGGSGYPEGCPTAEEAASYLRGWWSDVTGPVSSPPDLCCYEYYNPVSSGRPMMVDGKATRAAVGRGDAWSAGAASIDVTGLSADLRARLHDHWLDIARLEHASIASFAKLSLELLLVGAPVELLREAQRAGLDEVEHAATSFEIAAAYGGTRSAPGPMPELANARPEADIIAIVRGTIAEGCVSEMLGAFEVGEQAALADSQALRDALATIADDESRHAALAWRFVRWAVDDGRVDVAIVREAFAEAIARHRVSASVPTSPRLDDARAEHHGLLSPARRSALHCEALSRVERLAEELFAKVDHPAA